MLGLIFLVLSAAIQSECEEPVVIVVRVKPVGPEVTVEPGQDVTLKCQADDVTIRAVEWTRSDLVAPDYVLFYTDGHSDPTHQHSSFTGRVQLVDGELKNGDVSLILKNVSREDVGTYECRVETAGSRRKKRAVIDSEPISIVQLQVTEDQKGGNTPLRVGLGAAGVFLLVSAVVGLFLVRKSKRQRDNEPEPSVDEETGDNLL